MNSVTTLILVQEASKSTLGHEGSARARDVQKKPLGIALDAPQSILMGMRKKLLFYVELEQAEIAFPTTLSIL